MDIWVLLIYRQIDKQVLQVDKRVLRVAKTSAESDLASCASATSDKAGSAILVTFINVIFNVIV